LFNKNGRLWHGYLINEDDKIFIHLNHLIMKHLFTLIGFTAIMVSCKQIPVDETKVLPKSAEAAEYMAFTKWKAANDSREKEKTVVIYKPAVQKRVRTNEVKTVTTVPEKKGWSKAAKGAAIGAGTGAIAGAIINKKNRALGAVIGGVIGGGVGYGIGRAKDKKDGR
jgi:hypothetical protein